jgi:hypothetical protein
MDTLEIVGFLPGIPNSRMPTSTNTRREMSEKALKDIPLRKSIRTSGVSTRAATQERICPYLTVASIIGNIFPSLGLVKTLFDYQVLTGVSGAGAPTVTRSRYWRNCLMKADRCGVALAQDATYWGTVRQQHHNSGFRFRRGACGSVRRDTEQAAAGSHDVELARRILAET